METQEYFNNKKEIYASLLTYIDGKNENNEQYTALTNIFERQNILENPEELQMLLQLISKISDNHHRYANFFSKIDQILLFIIQNTKQTLSNSDLFNIFKNNKRILLFLFKNKLLVFDQTIIQYLHDQTEPNGLTSLHFFYPQIKLNDEFKETTNTIENELKNIDPNFETKCEIGENDSEICELIRTDSVEKLVSFIEKSQLSISTEKINPSLFETNPFLLDKEPTLIEYATFFGSTKIVQYLTKNKVKLIPSMWLYAIHSNNAELIRLLADNRIKPDDRSYKKCLEESIKCHHNEIAVYIQNKLMKRGIEKQNRKNNFDENVFAFCFQYLNYAILPNDMDSSLLLCYLCRFNYVTLVDILLKNKSINISEAIILKNQFFFYQIQKQIFFSFHFNNEIF